MTRWFWLSFADGDLPEGEQFLGVAIVKVDDGIQEVVDEMSRLMRRPEHVIGDPFFAAVASSRLLNLNPGGSVQGLEMPASLVQRIPEEMRERLLSRDELREAGLIE